MLGHFTVKVNNTHKFHIYSQLLLHIITTALHLQKVLLSAGEQKSSWTEQLEGTDIQSHTGKIMFVSKEISHWVSTAWRKHPVTSTWTLQQLLIVCGIFHWRSKCSFLTLQQSWATFSSQSALFKWVYSANALEPIIIIPCMLLLLSILDRWNQSINKLYFSNIIIKLIKLLIHLPLYLANILKKKLS